MSHGWRQHGHGLGHLGHCFLHDLSDLKTDAGARFEFWALGHLGQIVIVQKLVAGDVST